MPWEKRTIYITEKNVQEIKKRGENNISGTINRDLDRLYYLYQRALSEISLSIPEACLIVDALNGVIMDTITAPLLWAQIEEAVRTDGLDKKWEIDGEKLITKLKSLNITQSLAVIDAAERFWELPDEERNNLAEAIKECFQISVTE